MTHGDDKGLVLPPKVARYQVVIVAIVSKDVNEKELFDRCTELKKRLDKAGVRVHFDNRDNYNPGWKYNHWLAK